MRPRTQQVHQAIVRLRHPQGSTENVAVVVKVRHPHVSQRIALDFSLLRSLASLTSRCGSLQQRPKTLMQQLCFIASLMRFSNSPRTYGTYCKGPITPPTRFRLQWGGGA